MINREDMLELTRRMTVSRSSIKRIAGSYMDDEGYVDGTFNVNFLKLSASEKQANLNIAKAIPFADTNVNLKEFKFSESGEEKGGLWQLLLGMKACELKNDALMDTFYEIIAETYVSHKEYAVYVFHDIYDIPAKASDKERLWESEEVFEYMIGAVCPLVEEYTPGLPEWGFIFPMFSDRCGDIHRVGIYNANKDHPHMEMERLFQIKQ
jgi:hypothetical protein